MLYRKNLGENYSPLLFLASLGSGGLLVTFFMFLMFMLPHKGSPIPTYEHIMQVFSGTSLLLKSIAVIGLSGVFIFGVQNIRLLIWNIGEYRKFKQTDKFKALRSSNDEVQLMAIPLAYAMTLNISFIIGAVFVPKLWSISETLFPFALAGFGMIGIYAIKIFLSFFTRIIIKGNFDCEKNNSMGQMLSVFAFSMVSVGFSASGAMSHDKVVSIIGIAFSIFFGIIALILMLIKIVLGFKSMFEHGINEAGAVSLWIFIPIFTVLGIAGFRISMGLHHNFEEHSSTMSQLIFFIAIMSIQSFFAILGYSVMKKIGYYKKFITGEEKHPVAYAAICPGVAFFVMSNFLINRGLVLNGFIEKFSITYFVIYVPIIYILIKTIIALLQLNKRILKD